jgi:hypothetical protein
MRYTDHGGPITKIGASTAAGLSATTTIVAAAANTNGIIVRTAILVPDPANVAANKAYLGTLAGNRRILAGCNQSIALPREVFIEAGVGFSLTVDSGTWWVNATYDIL